MSQYSQMNLPPIGNISKKIIIALVCAFLVNSLLIQLQGVNLSGILGLSGVNLLNGHIWTLVTYPLLSSDLMGVIFNALILWFLGSELEHEWGERRYLTFIILTALVSAAIYLAIIFGFYRGNMAFAYPMIGVRGICSALCVIYGLRFPYRTMLLFLFPVQARWFVIILVAMNLYQGILSPGGASAWLQLAAMGFAALWLRFPELKRMEFKKAPKRKSHLRVVKDDDDITYH